MADGDDERRETRDDSYWENDDGGREVESMVTIVSLRELWGRESIESTRVWRTERREAK